MRNRCLEAGRKWVIPPLCLELSTAAKNVVGILDGNSLYFGESTLQASRLPKNVFPSSKDVNFW